MTNLNKPTVEVLSAVIFGRLYNKWLSTVGDTYKGSFDSGMQEAFERIINECTGVEDLIEKLDSYMESIPIFSEFDCMCIKEYPDDFDNEDIEKDIDILVIEYQDIVKNKNIHESVLVGNIYKYLVDEFLMKTKLVTRIEIEISKDIANDYDFKLEDVLDNLKEIYFEYKEEAIHDYITKSDTLTLKDITEDFFYNNKLWDIYTETYLGYVCIDRLKDIVSNKS